MAPAGSTAPSGSTAPLGFEQFCNESYGRLVAALACQTGDRGLAEELAHEALIRAGDRWDHVSALGSPLGWTVRVGANLGTSWFRRRAAEARALRRLETSDAQAAGADSRDDTRELTGALARLHPKQRQAVVMRFYLGLSAEETGQVLGMSAGAVRVLTHRATASLRQVLTVAITEEGI